MSKYIFTAPAEDVVTAELDFEKSISPRLIQSKEKHTHVREPLHLGVGHVHNVLVSFDTLHDVEAVPVQHFGLCISRSHQDDVPSDAVLQGLDLVADGTRSTREKDLTD